MQKTLIQVQNLDDLTFVMRLLRELILAKKEFSLEFPVESAPPSIQIVEP